MLFFLTDRISINRKIIYVGVIFLIFSIILIAGIDFSKEAHQKIVPLSFFFLICGISILLVSPVYNSVKKHIKNNTKMAIIYTAVFLPGCITIMVYLVCIFLGFSDFGQKYIVEGSAIIFIPSIPLLIFVQYLLTRKESEVEAEQE